MSTQTRALESAARFQKLSQIASNFLNFDEFWKIIHSNSWDIVESGSPFQTSYLWFPFHFIDELGRGENRFTKDLWKLGPFHLYELYVLKFPIIVMGHNMIVIIDIIIIRKISQWIVLMNGDCAYQLLVMSLLKEWGLCSKLYHF